MDIAKTSFKAIKIKQCFICSIALFHLFTIHTLFNQSIHCAEFTLNCIHLTYSVVGLYFAQLHNHTARRLDVERTIKYEHIYETFPVVIFLVNVERNSRRGYVTSNTRGRSTYAGTLIDVRTFWYRTL